MLIAFISTYLPAMLLQDYKWYDYPGVELWKFVNLAIFATGIYYLISKYVMPQMETRRQGIRRELMRAREERDAAQKKLTDVEARLARLDSEVEKLRENARKDSQNEIERIRKSTEEDAAKMREQARREVEAAGKTAMLELRRFAAERSIGIAEELIRREIRPEDDKRLIELEVAELAGKNGGRR